MKEYQTTNLYEASFLSCRGFRFQKKLRIKHKFGLVFEDSEEIRLCVADFYAGGSVNAKEFCDWYRTIKDYIFA